MTSDIAASSNPWENEAKFMQFLSVYCSVVVFFLSPEAKWHFLFLETNHKNAVNLCNGKKGGVKGPF